MIYITKLDDRIVEIAEDKDVRLGIYIDDMDIESSREWENLGHMICFHKRYDLGDKTNLSSDDFAGWDELEEYIWDTLKAVAVLPLGIIDHSGISMYIGRGSHPQDPGGWDSGQVGFIYATKEDIRKYFDVKHIFKEHIEKALDILRQEVEIYDKYLTGDIYGYIIEKKDGEVIDSCGGFYGSDFTKNGMKDTLGEYSYLLEKLEYVR